MTTQKFESEINTLDKFFTIYCENKHEDQISHEQDIKYKDKTFKLKTTLCRDCQELLEYSIARLQECPHEEKPRCRKCPHPCYEKNQWKRVAKLMGYSGMKLGLRKIKNIFKKS